jgi:hypothetical protein
MSEPGFPVTVAVTRPDGKVEQVRVGTAFKEGDGFRLVMGELAIGGAQDRPAAAARPASAAPSAAAGEPTVFPNYGRSKNAPIAGASEQDLEYYANGARRSLADPSKARWHDKETALLAAIEKELARQRGEPPSGPSASGEPPPPGDEDAPF